MRSARPAVAISSMPPFVVPARGRRRCRGPQEAAHQADAAAVRHEQRAAAVAGHVAQRGEHAALLVGQALAAGKAERLGVLAVAPPRHGVLAHDLGEQARSQSPRWVSARRGSTIERDVAAELLADDLGGLAGAQQVAGDDELEAAPCERATAVARLGAARLVEPDLGPAQAAGRLAVPVGLAVADEQERHREHASSGATTAARGDALSGSAAACRRARRGGASRPRSPRRAGCCRGSRWRRTA